LIFSGAKISTLSVENNLKKEGSVMRALVNLKYIDEIARAGSIRRAAESLSITPSALNRRLIAIEDDLDVQIFERLPRGVRLNAAGEILIQHIRAQISDFERVQSQIADLSGVRRGQVAIACSQALLPFFLPQQIDRYRTEYPTVQFCVLPRDRAEAEASLSDFSADLALVFEPISMADFHAIISVRQTICAVMDRDHPLAAKDVLRLRDCLQHPLALPTKSYGVRYLFDQAIARLDQPMAPALESDSFEFLRMAIDGSDLISFQIDVGLATNDAGGRLMSRPIAPSDMASGVLHLGHLRGRVLSVAAAKFATQLAQALSERYDLA
jgi:DNA-binding transcriptional LysR family regulator